MRKTPALFLAVLCFAFAPGHLVRAQVPGETPISQRALDRIYRDADAENAPALRTLFFQDEEDRLCVALGVKRGPAQILPGFLGFVRRNAADEKTKNQRLKFKFPKKTREEKGALLIWTDCLEVEDPARIPQDAMEITVRRVRAEKTETFVTPLPPPGATWGLDIWRHHGGELEATEYREGGV